VTLARSLSFLREQPVRLLRGVGAETETALGLLDIENVLDLLMHYPRRYVDRSQQIPISALDIGEDALVIGVVKKATARRTRQGRSLVEIEVFDGSSYLRCTFFNQAWRARQLRAGTEAAFFGKVDVYRGRRQMVSPIVDLTGDRTGRIIPLYPQSEKANITSRELESWIDEALERAGELVDPVPERWRDELNLQARTWAFREIHAPESMATAREARHRLAFDELFRLQLLLVLRKRAIEREAKGIRHSVDGPLVEGFRAGLPFALTADQEAAVDEIFADMAGPHPMHRLLQGDVGCGKTIVAVLALLGAVQGGHQGALMAPTEVLAEQHFLGTRTVLGELEVKDDTRLGGNRPVAIALLTNRTTAKEREKLHAGLAAGDVDILVGTHALLTERVEFRSLGLIVIDEQHRFGVEQRAALRGKGDDPDVLVMTATPIPRTAAMTVYGDLDMTTIEHLPPGRTPITTVRAQGPLEESAAWSRVRAEVEAGRQAYVVCPLIEDSEKIEARSAEQEHERLRTGELEGLRVALLHGRMPARDKEVVMTAFRRHDPDVLVATTVVEVGVDVPNATVMVVEDADRFGIAQLHQLRGRVGRGAAKSWCYLFGEATTPEAEARLEALCDPRNTGFELAEVDLELRGEGTILGAQQKGRSDLKLASLRRDKDLVATAREVAFAVVDADPVLATHPELAEELAAVLDETERAFLFKS
jgi:ATP-dependent DNA helicase RecG